MISKYIFINKFYEIVITVTISNLDKSDLHILFITLKKYKIAIIINFSHMLINQIYIFITIVISHFKKRYFPSIEESDAPDENCSKRL